MGRISTDGICTPTLYKACRGSDSQDLLGATNGSYARNRKKTPVSLNASVLLREAEQEGSKETGERERKRNKEGMRGRGLIANHSASGTSVCSG